MDLWIRSQDKTILIKVNRICFERNIDDEPTIYGYENYDNYERLGIYKTKERALEVLDEIQKLLMPIVECTPIVEEDIKPEYTYKHYVNCGYNTKVIQLNTYVYEMPKE